MTPVKKPSIPPREDSPVESVHGAGFEPSELKHKAPPSVPAFNIKRCRRPELVVASMTGITFGHNGMEYYALADGRMYRIAGDDEVPHAIYPKATRAHPDGVPMRAVVVEDLDDESYRRILQQLPAPAPKRVQRGADWQPGGADA